jgi:hypothetical protein
MNQNIFIFVQENQLTHYSKERGYRISVTPLYIIKPNGGVLKTFAIIPWHSPNTIPTTSANGQIGQLHVNSTLLHPNLQVVLFIQIQTGLGSLNMGNINHWPNVENGPFVQSKHHMVLLACFINIQQQVYVHQFCTDGTFQLSQPKT